MWDAIVLLVCLAHAVVCGLFVTWPLWRPIWLVVDGRPDESANKSAPRAWVVRR